MFVVLMAEMDKGGLDIGEESFEGGNGAFLWLVGIVERTGFCRGHYDILFEESGLFNLGLELDVQVVVDFCKKANMGEGVWSWACQKILLSK